MSRPYFEFRAAPELVADDKAAMAHIAAGRGDRYAFVYSPLGQPIRAFLDRLGGSVVKATWFDPRTAETQVFAIVPPAETLFVPPSAGKGHDWVLIDRWCVRRKQGKGSQVQRPHVIGDASEGTGGNLIINYELQISKYEL